MLQLRLSHPDKNWLIQLQSTGSPRELSCIWIMNTEVSDMVQMSLHMQLWHPGGACGCMLCLSPQKLTTIDCYPLINEPITDFKFVKELLAMCHRRSRSSIHNHIWHWCYYESYANNFGEATHLQQTCNADMILPHNHECSQDGRSQDARFWFCRDSCGGQPSHHWLFAVGVEW